MRRKRWSLFIAAVAVVGAVVGICSLRVPVRREKDGWLLEYTHARFRCRCCTAAVQRFEFNGQSIPVMPIQPDADHNAAWIETPVGTMTCDGPGYRPTGVTESTSAEGAESITSDELARGWYEVEFSTTRPVAECFGRKRGTPASWCLAHGEKSRWIHPLMLDKFEW